MGDTDFPKTTRVWRWNPVESVDQAVDLPIGPEHCYTMREAGLTTFFDKKAGSDLGVGQVVYVHGIGKNHAGSCHIVIGRTPSRVKIIEIKGELIFRPLAPPKFPNHRLEWIPRADHTVSGSEQTFQWRCKRRSYYSKGRDLVFSRLRPAWHVPGRN